MSPLERNFKLKVADDLRVFDGGEFERFARLIVYSGEMDHVIPWQTDQGISWRTYVANAVKAFSKVVI